MAVKHAILVGVGGQGAILTAKVLVNGLMKAGYDVKMSEVHGMSQRGGSVSTQVHWGEKVYSPLIGPGAADILVAFEKMEAVRYASFLKPEGVAVINDYEQPSATIAAGLAEYPAGCLEAMEKNFKCYTLNAAKIAGELGNPKCMNILEEETSFKLPSKAASFLCPQINPMTGWERTKPSYEEDYKADQPLNVKSRYGQGYTFPCLFRLPTGAQTTDRKADRKAADKTDRKAADMWILISETGVSSKYCASHLSDYSADKGYQIAFPMEGENNGVGSAFASISLPGETPWRTITVGETLKPIVETTIAYDVVEPLYEPSQTYKPGRYTWSWLIWQDKSINYDDQVKFIDLAAAMGLEFCLVDNFWDTQIGRERMAELSRYAQSKGVKLMLWYNSNGYSNDAPQGPRDCMNTAIAREREMKWLKSIGVVGIKVDFFGSDKQETMRLYEDILSDANRYGLQVVFHGCTIPRGWERMYPNYVSSEAALASENVYFTERHAKAEGFELTMHPFSRNALGAFDWGGVIMNRYMSKDNHSRHPRYTTDVFELATGITNQTFVQCIAMQPNNLDELPPFELDFIRELPTTWDETRFIDGYPTKYVVLARRHGNQWYVAGLNGTDKAMTLTLNLPMLAGKTVSFYTDNARKEGEIVPSSVLKTLKVDKKGKAKVTLQPMGGMVMK